MFTSETAQQLRPFVQRWIQEAAERADVAAGGGAPSPHALNSAHHTGTLADSQAPQFLKTNGSRQLTGNLSVASGVTIDGVDISAFKSIYDAHLGADSHGIYALAEGYGTRPAAYANRLNITLNGSAGVSVSPGGDLHVDQTIALAFSATTPTNVSLTAGAVGVSAQAARSDHRHLLDQSITPTWTNVHTFSAKDVHNAGARVAAGQPLEFGASASLSALGASPTILRASGSVRVNSLLGVNVDPLYRLHLKAGATNETLMVLENLGTTTQMVWDVGTAYNTVTDTPRTGSSNYASQTTGWRIDNEGGADFRYLFTDELHARAFIADIERALAGGQIITKSVGILTRDFVVPAIGALVSPKLYVEDLPGFPNTQIFTPGDIIRLRVIDRSGGGLAILDAWGSVTVYEDNSVYGGPAGEQRWSWSTEYYSTVAVIGKVAPKDGLALDYGDPVNGGGYLEALAYGAFTPYYQVVTWVTNPWTSGNRTVQGRYGNLNGITDINLNPSGFGFYTKNGYLDGTIYARDGRLLNSVIIGGGSVTAQNVAGWGWGANTTYIDGNQLFTGTVNTDKLNVGVGGGNLIEGANWNDDPTGVALAMPGGWERGGYGTVTTHKLEKDTAGTVTGVAGENYITATVGASSGTYTRTSNNIYVDTSRQYTLSAYTRRTSGTGTVSIGMECYNSSGTLLGYRFPTLDHGTATGAAGLIALQYRYHGTIGGTGSAQTTFYAGTHYVKVFIWCAESTSGSTTANLWQVQFEEGDLLTQWSPGLRGNVQIDSNKIMVGTPGQQRTEFVAEGIRGYNGSNVLQAIWDSTDGKIKAGGGKVELSSDGFALRTTASDAAFFLFKDGANATDLGTMYVYKRTSPSTKTMGALTISRAVGSTPAEMYIGVDTNSSTIALYMDGAANSGAGEVQVLGQFRVGSTQHSFLTGGLNVGSATGAATGTVKASGDLVAAGRVSTDNGTTLYELGTFTSAADAVSNGYVTITINGTAYKFMTRA